MAKHVVRQGEHIAAIAAAHGFRDFLAIWNYAPNKALKEKRKTPHVLFPGDELEIPARELQEETCAVDQSHPFILTRPPLRLRIALLAPDGKPVKNADCFLDAGPEQVRTRTDDKGIVQVRVPPEIQRARFIVEDRERGISLDLPLLVGHLDPVSELSGQRARLCNLGYLAPFDPKSNKARTLDELAPDERMAFRAAAEEFQCDFKLKVDGILGPQTQKKLVEVHGS